MKGLYIATSFPEPNKGATIYTDLAEALHEAGHTITVAVSEEPKNLKQTQIKRERGFDVLRIVTGNYYDVGLIEKGITSLRLPRKMKWGILKYLKEDLFDFILYESPPVTNASLIKWARNKFKCPSYLMLKDIFPQNAVDIGIMKKNSLIFRYFKYNEKKLYESADFIGCMSEANRQYIINHNSWIDQNKVELFPNTKKLIDEIRPKKIIMRKKYSIPVDACVFIFGGNMGKPQYVDLLCQAIIDCKHDREIFFIFIGRGTERYKLKKTIESESIINAKVMGHLPRDEYEQIMEESDVGLIVLDPRFTIPNYPSRILSYMEYSRPIIAATDKITDLKDLVEEAKCGEWVWSGDKDKFIETIKKMSRCTERKQMGKNGRNYLERKFSIDNSVDILRRHFVKAKEK